jgi:hypothetical protein
VCAAEVSVALHVTEQCDPGGVHRSVAVGRVIGALSTPSSQPRADGPAKLVVHYSFDRLVYERDVVRLFMKRRAWFAAGEHVIEFRIPDDVAKRLAEGDAGAVEDYLSVAASIDWNEAIDGFADRVIEVDAVGLA